MAILRSRSALWTGSSGDQTDSETERARRLMSYAEEFEDRWFWETDPDGNLTYLSKSVGEQIDMFGIKTVGAPIKDVFKIDQSDGEQARSLQFHLISRTGFHGYPVRGRKGLSESWWSMSGRPWFDEDGAFRGFVGSGTDLTKTLRQEATIKRLAHSDSLTGLANRQRMQENLESMLKSESVRGVDCSLMMLDLDGFKGVNDTLGHPTGDELLIQVAERLTEVVGERGFIGRLGGDEFQVLVPLNLAEDELAGFASEIIESISAPYRIDGNSISVSCSIGVATAAEAENCAETLVRNADIALYEAKSSGRATHRFFKNEMLVKATSRKELENDLRAALNSDQLHLVYQPVVETESENLVGFEALLRWTHPIKGPIGPAEFIPIAEESGLIQQLGDWVIRTAVEDLMSLPDDLRIAVNVSPIQFANPQLLATLATALGRSQIEPSRLELEITESVFLDDEEASQKTFASLKSLGVRLALDDFGTGYSSLGYLKSAPFDKIKIDQSFVRGAINPHSRNAAIIEAIVTLSKTLNMETTAEGVEHQDEIKLIRKLGCSHIQGFVYGSGLKISELLPKLSSGSRKVRAVGFKRSRSPRTNLLRTAQMTVNENSTPVRIRNISKTGAMIDQVKFTEQMIGVSVLIETLEDELREARVRWVGGDKAGLEFTAQTEDDS